MKTGYPTGPASSPPGWNNPANPTPTANATGVQWGGTGGEEPRFDVIRREIFVPGVPRAQPRPRAAVWRDPTGRARARVYDPGGSRVWKTTLMFQARNAGLSSLGHRVIAAAVEMHFRFCRPRSHYTPGGRLRVSAPAHHTSKPDIENLEKAVLDALTDAGVWRDDALVCETTTTKTWCDRPDQQGCAITLRLLVRKPTETRP